MVERDRPSRQPLEYQALRPQPPRTRLIMLVLGIATLLIVLLGAFLFTGVARTVVVTPAGSARAAGGGVSTPDEAAGPATPIAPEGLVLTIRQRSGAWLPGGHLRLEADDITGGQVLVSIKAGDGTVVFGPRSVRQGEGYFFTDTDGAELRLEVVRLRNFLAGEDLVELRITAPGAASRPASQTLSEAGKIDLLLARIEAMEGGVFIRNGSEHSAAEAAEHLRIKWSQAGGDRNAGATAEQFIESVASRSSLSGEPYRIRLPAGRVVESAAWLREQLRDLESGG